MSSFNDNRQNTDISWIDAGDAARLSEGFRAVFFQFFAAFKSNSDTFIIIEPARNGDGLVFLRPFRRHPFLLDVWRVMSHNINFSLNRQLPL